MSTHTVHRCIAGRFTPRPAARFRHLLRFWIIVMGFWPPLGANAQATQDEISSAQRLAVIKELNGLLLDHYVFPEVAQSLVEMLRSNIQSGAYDLLDSEKSFADQVTADMGELTEDKHLALWPTPPSSANDSTNLGTEMSRISGREGNYGIDGAKILPGNIGLIKTSSFSLDQLYEQAEPTLDAVMAMVANVDTLIFDLRNNRGGSPRVGRHLASYLFGPEPVHLNDFYFRSTDTTLPYWTLAELPGRRLPNIPVYILINKHTFSAAEGFAYNLKHLGRAIVVGQPSGGGAHGGSTREIGDRFQAYIPFSRSIHPITKTDFEGVGVIPQISSPPNDELYIAQQAALNYLIDQASNTTSAERYAKNLLVLKAQWRAPSVSQEILKSYVGTYALSDQQRLKISLLDGKLMGQMTGDEKPVSVSPVSQQRFRVDGHGVELTFNNDLAGNIVSLTLHQGDGIVAAKIAD